jgi:hypothetical protein
MMVRSNAAAVLLAAGLGAVLTLSCARKPPLAQLLADLEAAVEARDVGNVSKLLAPSFQAQDGLTAERVPEELRRYFFAYESLDVMLSEVVPGGTPPTSVSVRADMSGKPKELGALAALAPSAAAFRFHFGLAEKDGRLVITSARWDRLDNPTP